MTEINTSSGVILESLNNKLDRDLQNLDSNVDFVIRSKFPTTDDPTWYRIYKSGWCEQGGKVINGTNTFNIPFTDTNYTIVSINGYSYNNIDNNISNKTTTGFIASLETGFMDYISCGLIDINNI